MFNTAYKIKERLIQAGAGPLFLAQADELIKEEARANQMQRQIDSDDYDEQFLIDHRNLMVNIRDKGKNLYDLCISLLNAKLEQVKLNIENLKPGDSQ